MMHGYITRNGVRLIAAEAWIPDSTRPDRRKIGLLAILESELEELKSLGDNTRVGQLQEVLLPGLMNSRHVFEGLRRQLLYEDDAEGAAKKWVYSRKPAFDVVVTNAPNGDSGLVSRQTMPPDAQVLCALVTPNYRPKRKKLFPDIDGWIDRWNWVAEDFGLPEAPYNWIDRYDRKLFTIQDFQRLSE